MSVADDRTDEGQAQLNGEHGSCPETQSDVAELEPVGSEAGASSIPSQSPKAKELPSTPTQHPASGSPAEDEEFSEFQRPSSADGSLSIPDDLPSLPVCKLLSASIAELKSIRVP